MDIFRRIFGAIFFAITLATTGVQSECPDCSCPTHTYNINSEMFTWRERPCSDVWIPSNCMDEKKNLIFRKCINGTWTPNKTMFQILCWYENVEDRSIDCPHNFQSIKMQGSFPRTICIREKGLQYDFIDDKSVCIQDSIFTMNLNNKEQAQLIGRLGQAFTDYSGLLVLGARWRYPSKEISKNVNYEQEDVELHDIHCGRFGLPLKFNNTVPVYCYSNKCDNMCLHLNATMEPFSQLIDTCGEYIIARPEKNFLHEIGCPEGYYRTEYDYIDSGNHDACFSIKMFPRPIPVNDVEKENVIQSYCSGRVMSMNWGDDLFIFIQLSERLGLSAGDQCLFSSTLNRLVTYSDWNSSAESQTPFLFNWDKSMNYSRIISTDTVSYLTVNPNGQSTWALDNVSCIVCMVKSPLPIVELHLKYNVFERELVLTVTNQNFLYKEKSSDPGFICHYGRYDLKSYGKYRSYTSNVTIFRKTYATYLIENVGIGDYWCSGHNVINRLHIWNNERIFAYGLWYAFEVVRKCDTNCSFSLNDRSRFINFFEMNSNYVKIRGSTIVEHAHPISSTEYTFTALLSLNLYAADVHSYLATNWMNYTDYKLETFFIYETLQPLFTYPLSEDMNITSIKSTEYCLHDKVHSIEALIWRISVIGETISTSPLCPLQGNGSKITRTCSGNSVNGSFWDEPVNAPQCHTNVSESLFDLNEHFLRPDQTSAALESLEGLLLENIQNLLPLDVFLISRILQKVSNVTLDDLRNIFSIYNSLMQIDANFLKMSASMNSTNILLESFNNILMVYIESSILSSSEYQNSGKAFIHSSFIQTYILDPVVSKASGVALYRPSNSGSDENFTIYSSRYIYPNETINDIATAGEGVTAKDLVVGSYLPMDILHENITVVVTVFFNDKLFQASEEALLVKIYGKIIYLKILDLESTNPPRKITTLFQANQTHDVSICGHWSSASISEWSSSGCNMQQICVKNSQRLAVCECSGFTHFGYLINSSIDATVTEHDDHRLTIFTIVATSFSFFGTLAVIVTAVSSEQWREKISSKILIHFSIAISLETFVMISINFDEQFLSVITSNTFACVTLGSILHYSVLAMSFWMLIFAYFQFKRFIAVLNFEVSHLWFKFIILGWVVPLLPIILVLLVDHSLYIPENEDEVILCYPTGYALYLGVIAPIALTCLTNFIMLTSVLASLHIEGPQFKITFFQVLASAFLFIDLGLASIFSFLSKIYPNSLFLYIFFVTASIQGPFLLLNFVAFNISFILQLVHTFANLLFGE